MKTFFVIHNGKSVQSTAKYETYTEARSALEAFSKQYPTHPGWYIMQAIEKAVPATPPLKWSNLDDK